jgi:hypothetical protein
MAVRNSNVIYFGNLSMNEEQDWVVNDKLIQLFAN